MSVDIFTSLAWLMVLCSGIMTGIYLTFSLVIMRSLAALEPEQGMAAMKSINREILKTLFMPLFFGSTIIALIMVMTAIWRWGTPGDIGMLAAGMIYAIGMFVVTAALNVPLNNKLEQTNAGDETAERTWDHYLTYWTRWNTIRTAACAATLIISIDLL